MTMPSTKPAPTADLIAAESGLTSLGEFPLHDALAAARHLEHAGITATLAAANGVWAVHVASSNVERARRIA